MAKNGKTGLFFSPELYQGAIIYADVMSASSPLSGRIVALSLVIAVLAVAFLGSVAYAAMSQRASQAATVSSVITTQAGNIPSTVTVTGTGLASGAPDEVQITLGVTNTGSNASKVLVQNSENMSEVLSAIEMGLHVNASDVQTSQFNYGPSNGCCSPSTSYTATNLVLITLRGADMTKLQTLINAAVNAGANQIQNIQYLLSNSLQAQLKQQAVQRAIADANQTALRTAAAENVKVTGIQSVIVLSNYYPPQCCYGGFAQNLGTVPAVDYSVPLSPGQTQFNVEVQVTYLLG